jgi:hypothetical protein
MEIIHTSFKDITLSSKLLVLKTPKGEIALDIHQLLNASSDTENAYFNATQMAKLFDRRYEHVVRNEYWVKTVGMVDRFLITQNRVIKKIKKMDKIFYDDDGVPKGVVSRRGRFGGTWLHQKLAITFMRMLDPEWGFELDNLFEQIVKQTVILKVERKNTIALFHPLVQTIKEKYIPAQISEASKTFAYPTLLNLANHKAIGMTSQAYKELNGLTKEKIANDGNISIRDYMNQSQLDLIKQAEKDIDGIINYGRIYSYSEIKERLFSL